MLSLICNEETPRTLWRRRVSDTAAETQEGARRILKWCLHLNLEAGRQRICLRLWLERERKEEWGPSFRPTGQLGRWLTSRKHWQSLTLDWSRMLWVHRSRQTWRDDQNLLLSCEVTWHWSVVSSLQGCCRDWTIYICNMFRVVPEA